MSQTQKNKIDGRRRIKENVELHKSIFGHEPLFTLTPAGAKALLKYFVTNNIQFSPVGGACGQDHGVDADDLRKCFAEIFSQPMPAMNANVLCELLGVASTGMNSYGCELVAIDKVALEILAESKALENKR